MCSFNDSFLFLTESWQLLLAGCRQHPGGLMKPQSARRNRHSGCDKPHVPQRPHIQTAEGQLFPVPHLLGLRNHRNPYPRNGITGDENQELRRFLHLRRCMRFHTIKTYWYLPVANINIFIYTSVCPWQVTVFENINFPITSSTHSPLHSHSCPYCFQINHYALLIVQASLPLNIPLDCQNACNWKTFLPD